MTAVRARSRRPLTAPDQLGDTLVATADSIEAMMKAELAEEFRILAPLGWGRWGMRFHAKDRRRSEEVVLTGLPAIDPALPAEGERYLEALRRAALLDHPHLVPICGYGVCGPLRWFATAPVADETLAARIEATGVLPIALVRRIAQQAASALDQAHRRGLAHGALSANEILIDRAGWVRVMEVGIAAGVEREEEGHPVPARPAQGDDQVDLADILRTCLTGGRDAPVGAEVPVEVENALRRAAHPHPAARFHDLLDLADALDTSAEPTAASRVPPTPGQGAAPNAWDAFLEDEELEPAPPPAPRWKFRAAIGLAVTILLVGAAEGVRLALVSDGPKVVPVRREPASALVSPQVETAPAPVVEARPPVVDTPAPSPPRRSAPQRVVTPPAERTPRPTLPAATGQVVAIPPAPAPAPAAGTLSISSFPWGELSVDGHRVGNTPQAGILLRPGKHTVRVSRDGYQAFETTIDVAPGEVVRLTEIALKELTL